jgi:hypothetical protein
VIAVCAVIACAESWEDIALYGQSKQASWIMMRSATDLSKADLHVFSKLFDAL